MARWPTIMTIILYTSAPGLAGASGDSISKRPPPAEPVFVGPGSVSNVEGASAKAVYQVLGGQDIQRRMYRCSRKHVANKTLSWRVSLTVDPSGLVTHAQLSNKRKSQRARSQRAKSIGRCIEAALRKAKFSNGHQRKISFDLKLGAKRRRQPIKRSGIIGGGGSLHKEVIRRVIRRNIKTVKVCYEKYLADGGTIQGRLLTQFNIAASGKVVGVKIVHSAFKSNQSLHQCMTSAILKWLFPKPKGGGIVIVSYPFVFKAAP